MSDQVLGERIAEPLVGKFVGDETLGLPFGAEMVGSEHGQRLRLERDLELLVGDDDVVAVERVGPEEVDEDIHHRVLDGQAQGRGVPVLSGEESERDGTRRGPDRHGDGALPVAADLHGR